MSQELCHFMNEKETFEIYSKGCPAKIHTDPSGRERQALVGSGRPEASMHSQKLSLQEYLFQISKYSGCYLIAPAM